jgi:hypothetical protein
MTSKTVVTMLWAAERKNASIGFVLEGERPQIAVTEGAINRLHGFAASNLDLALG